MTGRERLLAVLKGKPVDTVPCVPNMPEQFVDAFPGIKGENSLERAFNWIRQVGGDIFNRRALPYEVKYHHVEIEISENKREKTVRKEYRTPVGSLFEKFKEGKRVERCIKEERDLEILKFIEEDKFFVPRPEVVQTHMKMVGSDGINFPQSGLHCSAVQRFIRIDIDLSKFYYFLNDYPKKMEELFELIQINNRKVYEIIARSNIKQTMIAEDTSIDLISPKLYEKYSISQVRDFTRIMHKHGKMAIVHMCGRIKKLLPLIKRTELDGIDALTPPPAGDITFEEVFDFFGEDFLVIGLLPANLFFYSDTKKIITHIKDILPRKIARKRFILLLPSPVQFNDIAVPTKTVREVIEFVREYYRT